MVDAVSERLFPRATGHRRAGGVEENTCGTARRETGHFNSGLARTEVEIVSVVAVVVIIVRWAFATQADGH